ncbi:sister chromatid cohesion protein PDS5 homolog D-like isoform X2 [Malania oleifera]|uniref:sister chromatid cohesion protein PDS5 homolog D-like isoform X2 n=1 Tax=Malania oleifera TaxID=397392 RepID=UPI0025AE7F87|nr:sister chromatid cohesion protein PDS5 homolog D-like isoform X2 [Malania oleifera]
MLQNSSDPTMDSMVQGINSTQKNFRYKNCIEICSSSFKSIHSNPNPRSEICPPTNNKAFLEVLPQMKAQAATWHIAEAFPPILKLTWRAVCYNLLALKPGIVLSTISPGWRLEPGGMDSMILADLLAGKNKKKLQSIAQKGTAGKSKIPEASIKGHVKGKVGGYRGKSKGEKSVVEKDNKGSVAEKNRKVDNEESCRTPRKRKRGADEEMVQAFFSSSKSSRLRPRKEMPAFRKIELNDGDDEKIIGKRIKVYWSGSRRWFIGRVKSFDNEKSLHKIHYEDGDKEDLDLRQELFELELIPGDSFTLKNEPISVRKTKSSDGGKLSAEALKEDSVKVADAEKVKKNHGRKKNKKAKQAVKIGSSKSQRRKDNIVKKTDDHVMEMDAGSGKDHDKSECVSEMAMDVNEAPKVQAIKPESKIGIHLKKRATQKAVKGKGSNLQRGEDSKPAENPAANMEIETNVEDALDVLDGKTEPVAKHVNEKDDKEIGPDICKREEIGRDAEKRTTLKIKLATKGAIYRAKDDMVGLSADAKLAAHAEQVEEIVSSKVNVEGPGDVNPARSNKDETGSLLGGVSEGTCQVPANLQRALDVKNSESSGELLKESSEGTVKTSILGPEELAEKQDGAGDTHVDLTSRITAKAMEGGNMENAESQKNYSRRGRSKVRTQ